jgi:hypothetical protein
MDGTSASDPATQTAVVEAMRFIYSSAALDVFEFSSRIGVTRAELGELLASWPESSGEPDARAVAGNCLNEVCNGLTIAPQERERCFTVDAETLRAALERFSY